MVIENNVFLGTQLTDNKWKASRMNDLYFEIKLLPEFDKDSFPYAVGLNSDQQELILTNLKTRKMTSIARIVKKGDTARISDIQISCTRLGNYSSSKQV